MSPIPKAISVLLFIVHLLVVAYRDETFNKRLG